MIQGRRKTRLDSYCCFLDIKKAYDTVFREGLWRRLREVGVEGRMWRVLKNVYVKVESSVVVNEERTEWFELYTGVRQGCILSPTLFAIFIDGLATWVKQRSLGAKFGPVELSILLFADDIALVADNVHDLQEMLHVADAYSKLYRFGFNGSKSNVVVFSGRKKVELKEKVYLGELVLEQKLSYKYLGLEIDRGWNWSKVKERMLEKARKRVSGLYCTGVKQGLSVKAAVQGWEVLVRPVLEYGCEIWGEGKWREAEALQSLMGKRILGVSKMTSGAVVRGELGWWRMEARRDLARLRFWGKLVRMEESRLVKRVYRERRRRFDQGKSVDTKNWCYRTREILVGLGLEEVWEGERVGPAEEWGPIIKSAIAAREEREWAREMSEKPKLRTYRKLKSKLSFEPYLNCGDSWRRSLMTMMRGGTNMLRIERGRWDNEKIEERTCRVCMTDQVEDEQHFLLDCSVYKSERESMYREIERLTEWKYNIQTMKHDKDRMLDVLIGQGLPEKTQEIVEVVFTYLNRLVKIRKGFVSD